MAVFQVLIRRIETGYFTLYFCDIYFHNGCGFLAQIIFLIPCFLDLGSVVGLCYRNFESFEICRC